MSGSAWKKRGDEVGKGKQSVYRRQAVYRRCHDEPKRLYADNKDNQESKGGKDECRD